MAVNVNFDENAIEWLAESNRILSIQNERRLILVDGDSSIQASTVKAIGEYCHRHQKSLLCWGHDIAGINCIDRDFRHQLGREYDAIIFHDDQFHADAFAALSGTIKAGGFLFWLPTHTQQSAPDYFIARLFHQISIDHQVIKFGENFSHDKSLSVYDSIKDKTQLLAFDTCTNDQLVAVKAIIKVAEGRANRPLVLTADRGRGKSSALGLASGHLIQHKDNSFRIVICAPVRDSVEIFFQHAANQCPRGEFIGNHYVNGENFIEFMPIDKILHERPSASLLIVDEAAALPLHLLNRLVSLYPRIIFSSTEHGYEGAGRGFATKFRQTLKKLTPNYRHLQLTQPIRWRENDPLEQWVFSAFLLNTTVNIAQQNDAAWQFHPLSKKELFESESLLRQVFSILVSSHYQTSPTDLKLILTNPSANIFVLKQSSIVVAVSLIIEEGIVSQDELNLMKNNKKQLKNQFIPQYLYRHCVFEQAFEFTYWRISRIAVNQAWQNKGIGSLLLAELAKEAKRNHIEFLATSFAANAHIVNFWQKANFVLADIGLNKDKASGEYSAVLLKALSEHAVGALEQLHYQVSKSFWYKLTSTHRDIEPNLAYSLVRGFAKKLLPVLDEVDNKRVQQLMNGQGQLAQSAHSICVWLVNRYQQLPQKYDTYIQTDFGEFSLLACNTLMIRKFWLCHDDTNLVKDFNLTGKKQLTSLILASLKSLEKATH